MLAACGDNSQLSEEATTGSKPITNELIVVVFLILVAASVRVLALFVLAFSSKRPTATTGVKESDSEITNRTNFEGLLLFRGTRLKQGWLTSCRQPWLAISRP